MLWKSASVSIFNYLQFRQKRNTIQTYFPKKQFIIFQRTYIINTLMGNKCLGGNDRDAPYKTTELLSANQITQIPTKNNPSTFSNNTNNNSFPNSNYSGSATSFALQHREQSAPQIFIPSNNMAARRIENEMKEVITNPPTHWRVLPGEQSAPKISISSNNMASRRIENEMKEIITHPPTHWRVLPGEQWNKWDVQITTQNNTPYHSVPFRLIVTFPKNYPYEVPVFKLPEPHKFFHPNISFDGSICEQTLKTLQSSMAVRQRIDAFVTLLAIPNPDSPLNTGAASLCKTLLIASDFTIRRFYYSIFSE